MHFRLAHHMVAEGDTMVEVWRDGQFVAGIYPHEEGLRVVSKYLDGVQHEDVKPPSVVIQLSEEARG